jgi:type II pantothenate kinase
VPQAGEIFTQLSQLYNVNFVIPPNAEFATATGAAISFVQGIPFTEIPV